MRSKTKKKSHAALKVLGVILLVLVIAAGALAWNFRSYLSAAVDAAKYSTEEIESRLQDNEARIAKAIESMPEIQVRDLTDEEKQKLESGELSEDEVIGLLTGGEPASAVSGESENSADVNSSVKNEPAAETKPAQPAKVDYSQEISAQIARAYVLRSQFTGQLDGLLAQAKSEYHSIPPSERSTDRKAEFIEKYMGLANSMEASCDASMNEIVSSVRQMLKDSGQSTALADEIMSTYESEKSLKKSYYMSFYM